VWECINDPIINNAATDTLARAFGTGLLSPFNHEVPGMDGLAPPVFGNFQWEGGSSPATRLLIHREYPDVPAIQLHSWVFYTDKLPHEKSAACFLGRITAGVCSYE
jgi:hypothetical protein